MAYCFICVKIYAGGEFCYYYKNMQRYNPKKIEEKWQEKWYNSGVFKAKNGSKKKKFYLLVEFPYPSGEGLHMGHLRPYVAADVYTRFNRMKGFETLFPIGWDAFGLPAENYAIKKGIHPSITTTQNIKNAKKQMQSWGLCCRLLERVPVKSLKFCAVFIPNWLNIGLICPKYPGRY